MMQITRVTITYMLTICTAASANISGYDDFNGGEDWQWGEIFTMGNAGYAETNGHLHFLTLDNPGSEAYRALLPWLLRPPFSQDWEVQLAVSIPELNNNSEQQYECGLILSPFEIGEVSSNRIGHTVAQNENNQKTYYQNLEVNSVEILDYEADRVSDSALLRIKWFATTSNLISDISTDGGITWTNYWQPVTNPFNMEHSDTFVCMLYAASEGRPITISDNLYLDDFKAEIYIGNPPLSGTDEFDDSTRNPDNWFILFGDALQETNNRLEYVTKAGSAEDNGLWTWMSNSGSCTQDWTVTIDVHNSAVPSGNGQGGTIELSAFKDFGNGFWIGLPVIGTESGTERKIEMGWNIDDIDTKIYLPIDSEDATLRISYDSVLKKITSAYDLGDGFVTATNLDVNVWGLTESNSLGIATGAYSENLLVNPNQIYADNFETVTLPGISNNIEFIFLSHTHEFEDPLGGGNEVHEFNFEITADESFSNIICATPHAETLQLTYDPWDSGWKYDINDSPTSLVSRFDDGDYTITCTYSNGIQQSTIIRYPPLADVVTKPSFTSPDQLHGSLFSATGPSSMDVTLALHWEVSDTNVNLVDLHRHHIGLDDWESLGLFSDDAGPFADGPFSTRKIESIPFDPGDWGIESFNGNAVVSNNAHGILYVVLKETLTEYEFTVLDPNDDHDGDDIPNWWESKYFGRPTNAVATLDTDLDGHNNLQESITGMDPTNASSCFMITNCVRLTDDFLIEWPSVSGRVYTTYWSTNLMTPFQPLETDIVFPRNSSTDTTHNVESEGFYKVEVKLK